MKAISRQVGLVLVVLAGVVPAAAAPFPQVHELKLANGMKFLLVPRGEAPIFSAMIRFRVGGVDEEPGKTGLAHLMEHMAFKGTAKQGELELTRLVEQEGGQDFNASTSKDWTTYRVDFPTERLRFWAELESERIFRPVFRDFEKERKVVMEERRMRVDDDPDGFFYEKLMEASFRGTPYGWPTVGLEKDLATVSEADLNRFWQDHYHPSRAVGVLVGRFNLKEAETILRETFGRIPKGRPQPLSSIPNPSLERELKVRRSARPRVAIGYLKPTLPDRVDYVFDLIDQILGDGRSSRLFRHLVLEKRVASGVVSYQGVPGARSENLFLIEVQPIGRAGSGEVIREIEAVIEAFRGEGPTEREVQKAINRLKAGLVWRLKGNHQLAAELSYFELAAGNWRYVRDYPDVAATITREEILEVAKRYLVPENRIVGVMEP